MNSRKMFCNHSYECKQEQCHHYGPHDHRGKEYLDTCEPSKCDFLKKITRCVEWKPKGMTCDKCGQTGFVIYITKDNGKLCSECKDKV